MEKIIKKLMDMGAEYCDIRYEKRTGLSLEVKDGELKKAVSGSEEGIGIRVLYNGAFGFFSTNNVSDADKAAGIAFKLAKCSKPKEKLRLADVKTVKDEIIWKPKRNPADISTEEKHKLIAGMDEAMRGIEGILTVTTGYSDGNVEMHFLNSEGSDIYTIVPRIVAQADLIAKKDGNIVGYRTRVGGTSGFEIFDSSNPLEKGVNAAKSAVRILSAEKSPSGRFPVITDPDLAGVFAHEAIGHAAEGDSVVSGESILEKKIGEKVASELVTIYDDPAIENGFGSFPYDDEGVKGTKKILIEKGVLKNFILNRETAHKLGMKPNGGARAESFAVRPLVRMSNTMIEKGEHSFDELIEDIKYGIYAKGTRGGQVDPAKGSFQFSAQEAFLIEKGEITKPLKDLSLSGLTLETLKNIDAVGKDVKFGDPGFCGKGQLVPVGDGGPHIKIKNVLIGGG
ncbi:MAG: TldD/PmbA family protein [Euryarchaeota archaeon CG01_land_8_20_14_3_00_38_12]|nr:MAG: TldD/PmbA family protein [Euryarchaeota archaeon CG01_land_8_20_14_3_00_38_12]PJB21191.1 MAG: TldD/PmbA family protein [Euryarchaeota archaeon CG_4_9_14_3_um_filter_38_12]